MNNPMTMIDGYKLDHRRQYPEGTEFVYSNWTPRGSRIDGQEEVVFFGLQYFLQRYLMDEMQTGFFGRPVEEVVDEYQRRIDGYVGPNEIGTDHIRALHALGYVPLVFKALPEGTRVPLRVPMFTVENTLPEFFWLVNYFETLLSSAIWLPCTSATTAARFRVLLNDHAEATGSDLEMVQWQGHDFSFRGMAGPEAAAMSAAGHLLSFTGTDTVPALDFIERYYTDEAGVLLGGSVPATEHSVMCAGGQDGEIETFERLLSLYPSGIVSVVSDTWDLWEVLTSFLPKLHAQVMARGGKLVIRPDSGDPVKIICGDPNATGAEQRGVVELLWDEFGGTTNAAGYKELDPHVGVIYGDAISYDRANRICHFLEAKGFASGNIVFGVGSYTYQFVTRDTYGFAMKATSAVVNRNYRDLFKDPVTDSGEKKSATGRLAVVSGQDGKLELIEKASWKQEHESSLLKTVWSNGQFRKNYTFSQVRDTLWNNKGE